jgi:hypothetical protein
LGRVFLFGWGDWSNSRKWKKGQINRRMEMEEKVHSVQVFFFFFEREEQMGNKFLEDRATSSGN